MRTAGGINSIKVYTYWQPAQPRFQEQGLQLSPALRHQHQHRRHSRDKERSSQGRIRDGDARSGDGDERATCCDADGE